MTGRARALAVILLLSACRTYDDAPNSCQADKDCTGKGERCNSHKLCVLLVDAATDTDGSVLVSSMGFVKADLESIAGQVAERAKISTAPLFLPTESIPTVKPG